MGWFNRKKEEKREDPLQTLEELLLQANIDKDTVTSIEAKQIPAVTGCLNLISSTVAMLNCSLYKEKDGKTIEFKDDYRVKLLNDDTRDTLNAVELKNAMIEEYYLNGNAYAYINKKRNIIKSINYVESSNVSVQENFDPIFKSFDIVVDGETYRDFQFLKLLRNTKSGADGKGIIEENPKILAIAYNGMVYENLLVKTGGNKKGFLKSENKLDKDTITALKEGWKNLYGTDTSENVVVLNRGVDFKEASMSSVEMQLNENKLANAKEICKLFQMSNSLLDGNANKEEYKNFIKTVILPLLKQFETALNKTLLLESEKDEGYYFAFDTKEILKADRKERFEALKIGMEAGFITANEARNEENFEEIEGLNIISKSLGDVIYDVDTGKWFTPNMDSQTDLSKNNALKGGENDGNKES